MKNQSKTSIMKLLMFAMIACAGIAIMTPAYSDAKTVTRKRIRTTAAKRNNKKTTALEEKVDKTKENQERFLEVCKTMGENLHNRGFRYGYSSKARSYSSALKHKRVATCATYATWCLQEYGVLKKGKLFYCYSGGEPNKKKWNKNKIKVVKVYKTTKRANLQPGDVVCWASGKAHVCIYAGKNSKGKRVWYDAGRHQSTYGQCEGSRYKVVSARHNKYLENRLVGYVLRIQ